MNEPTNWSLQHLPDTEETKAGRLNGLVHKFPGRGRPLRARAPQLHLPGSNSTASARPAECQQRVTFTPDGTGRRAPSRTPPQINTEMEGGKNTRVGNVTQQLELLQVILKRSTRCYKTGDSCYKFWESWMQSKINVVSLADAEYGSKVAKCWGKTKLRGMLSLYFASGFKISLNYYMIKLIQGMPCRLSIIKGKFHNFSNVKELASPTLCTSWLTSFLPLRCLLRSNPNNPSKWNDFAFTNSEKRCYRQTDICRGAITE